uniref:Apoptosis regulator BAX n=1 Tax=Lepeophtheirus salmonis TaxID=72036 RepID=D3PFN5_LEPSM|nr:Apoptosis regulator BAX [Lepeophtheirus salmonis]
MARKFPQFRYSKDGDEADDDDEEEGAIPVSPRILRRRRNSEHDMSHTPRRMYNRPRFNSFSNDGFFPIENITESHSNDEGFSENEIEGQELYLHFLYERMSGEGLDPEAHSGLSEYHFNSVHDRERGRQNSMSLDNFHSPLWRRTGRELQSLADEFVRTQEREQVRILADSVDVVSLNMEKFFALLRELFQGGKITRERILVLFFFCSDIAIRAARCQMDGLLVTLTNWSLRFIREKVCSWVNLNGGWQTVLHRGVNVVQQMAIIGMCAAVMLCCTIYIRKNL